MSIAFIDLKAQQKVMRGEIDQAISKVLDDGQYILGQALKDFETELCNFSGSKHALGMSSGTDALVVPLMAWGVGPGDAVFVPSFTYTATAEAILLVGASIIYVDVDSRSFNIDVEDLKLKISETRKQGKLNPKVILSVDLFGLPVDYLDIQTIAREENLHFLSDAAQGFGGSYSNKRVGSLADVTATSFFPAKPLGCYGDGGAVFTNDEDLCEVMRSIRTHGQGKHKYDISRVGLNARLDTIQAAILSVKMKYFEQELIDRNKLANAYDQALSSYVETPIVPQNKSCAWAQYTIQLELGARETFQAAVKEKGIPTMVYYPTPMHFQPPYHAEGFGPGSLPVSEALCGKVVALPMHPYMSDEDRDTIIDACTDFFKR